MEMTQNKRKRSSGWPFVKGRSGNAGGRPRNNPEVVEMLKAATPAATALLVSVVEDEHAPLRLRLQAAETILDRVYGRASQPIEASFMGGSVPLTITFEGQLDKWSQ